MFAILVSQGMNAILSLSVNAYSISVIVTQDCLGTMLGQWFSSCGRQIYMGLPSMSQIA